MKYSNLILLFAIFMLLLTAIATAQTLPSSIQSLNKNDYQSSITALQTEIKVSIEKNNVTFVQLTTLAIALQKTQGWETEAGKALLTTVAPVADAGKILTGLRKLLREDSSGMLEIFSAKALIPELWQAMAALKLLYAQGFSVAANTLTVFTPVGQGERVMAWLRIPLAQRQTVTELMDARYPYPGVNRHMLMQAALELYKRPPADLDFPAADILELAISFGKEDVINASTMAQLQGVRPEGAQKIRNLLFTATADDYLQQLNLIDPLWNSAIDVIPLYQKAMTTVPEPWTRHVRLDYLEFLLWKKDTATFTSTQQGTPMLFAADALLLGKEFPKATDKYAAVFTDPGSALPTRVDAWCGLLDSDPARAFAVSEKLLAEVAALPLPTRRVLVMALARQLWHAVERELPPASGTFSNGKGRICQPLTDVTGWQQTSAQLLQRLLEIDAESCLRPSKHDIPDTLRLPAATIFALAQQPEKSVDMLYRKFDYKIDPPPGGWRMGDGSPDKEPLKPHDGSTPRAGESEKALAELLATITRNPRVAQCLPPLLNYLPGYLVTSINDCADSNQRLSLARSFSAVIKATVTMIDPLPKPLRLDQPAPPIREVDMTRFAPLEKAYRQALFFEAVARMSPIFLREGLLPGMMSASNPKLLEALYTLTTDTLDRYSSLTDDPKSTREHELRIILAGLDNRRVYDTKPYANRLREKYGVGGRSDQ